MEALYLLLSLVTTTVTSAVNSLLLPLRSLLKSNPKTDGAVIFYSGHVHHSRRRPVAHAFTYPVKYALIDLDLSLYPSHLSADYAREITATDGKVLLLTIPGSVGYEQNPLSVYYCYGNARGEGEEGCLEKCIAEVTNTPWGERVNFVFDPKSDLVAKPLHVSPFMDMLGNWSIRADAPGEDLSLIISVQHPTLGNYFTATLSAKRVSLTSGSHNMATYFWLMPHKVAVWIYWQALKLWWKNVAFLQHPKYSNPGYREDCLARDQLLDCPFKTGQLDNRPNYTKTECGKSRSCVWTDAKWPWS